MLKSSLFFELQELGQKMSGNKKERFSMWKKRHEALWQFIMFALVGCVTSVVVAAMSSGIQQCTVVSHLQAITPGNSNFKYP